MKNAFLYVASAMAAAAPIACSGPRAAPAPAAGPPLTAEPEHADPPEAPPQGSEAATRPEPADASAGGTKRACQRDADCTMTTFSGCCACCAGSPRAVHKQDLARAQQTCSAVLCPPGACADQDCAPAPDLRLYRAECVEGRCVGVVE